jgi:hypothetical protein
METNEVTKTQTQEQTTQHIMADVQPRPVHRPSHRLDIRHFTQFQANPQFGLTYDISKADGRLKRFDYARTNGTILHMWEKGFYTPDAKSVTAWEGIPDIESVLKMELVGGVSLKLEDFLKWIPTNRKLRENTFLKVIVGDGIVDLELVRKEDKQVIIPTEEPSFEIIEQATYNAEFVYYSLCGMSKVFKLWIGSHDGSEEYKPLVMASELTVAMIANIKKPIGDKL